MGEILAQWGLIEADMHDVYGVDLDSGILADRSWRWLRVRVQGLLNAETRLARHFRPDEDEQQPTEQY